MTRHTRAGDVLWLIGGFLTLVGCWMILVLAAWGVWTTANAIAATQCSRERTQASQNRCLINAVRWNRQQRRMLEKRLAIRYRRDATYAVRLAAAAFNLPEAKLRCIAERESGLGTQRTPEPSSGASGEMQFLAGTWRSTPFSHAGFSVWDNVANVLAAAQIIRHDGSARQWVTGRGCGL